MSLATSVNGTKLKCRPVQRMSADDEGCGLGTNVQFMTRLRNSRYFVFYAGHLTRTYEPGASSIIVSLPPPGSRAGTRPESSCVTHSSQTGHHDSR